MAYLTHSAEISRNGRHRAGGRSDDRLGYESDDRFRAEAVNFLFESIRDASAISFGAFAGFCKAILEAGLDQGHVDEQRLVRRSPPRAPPRRERAQRVAMI